MASFKLMHSSDSRNSDLSHHLPSSSSSIRHQHFILDPYAEQSSIRGGYCGWNDGYNNTMTVEGILQDTFASDPPATESTLLDGSMSLIDTQTSMEITTVSDSRGKSVDEVWREIVSGEGKGMKEEMTLEDFLAKATGEENPVGRESDDVDVKIPLESLNYGFDQRNNQFQMIDKVEGSIVAFGNGNGNGNGMDVYGGGGGARGKRARVMVEPLDKAAAQRQRRMIKNRESAARSRERKQAYQVELETLAAKLEEENEILCKEIEEKRKERYNKLMEFVIPVVEKPTQQPRFLRRIRSLEW